MKLTVVGSGDAFGSGGRYQSCYLLDTGSGRLMIDCGATSYLALKRAGISIETVDAILISHCHGDHYGGLPFLLLDKLFGIQAPAKIEVIGPPGIQRRLHDLAESLYFGVMRLSKTAVLTYREIAPDIPIVWRELIIRPYLAAHDSGSPSLMLSISDEKRTFAFSGDTGWCENIVTVGRDADLFLVECTSLTPQSAAHLDFHTLSAKFGEIGARKYLLTHLGADMLEAEAELERPACQFAHDGMVISI